MEKNSKRLTNVPTCQPCQTARKTSVTTWLIIRLFRNLKRYENRQVIISIIGLSLLTATEDF
jgi:hypothetical protein